MGLVKVLLVGEAETGKTGLIKRYLDHTFEQHESTIGIDFSGKSWNQDIKIQLWDTGGKPQYRNLVHGYLHSSGDPSFLICADASKPWGEEIKSWVKEIRKSLGQDVPIWLVLNKSDLIREEEKEGVHQAASDLSSELKLKGFFVVSAKASPLAEIEDLFRQVITANKKFEQMMVEKEKPRSHEVKNPSRPIGNTKQRREENQIQGIWNSSRYSTGKAKILAILNQVYTKSNSRFFRIITGCWARHHIRKVESLIKNRDELSTEMLIAELIQIAGKGNFNPTGTLATIIKVINDNRSVAENSLPSLTK